MVGGHSESVNVEFERPFDIDELKAVLDAAEGVVVVDNTYCLLCYCCFRKELRKNAQFCVKIFFL